MHLVSERPSVKDAERVISPACRIWHRKLEEEAGGMVDAILRDTEHQVRFDLVLSR